MKVQFIQSACVVVEHQGIRVLCDPWLTDGIYYGSWYHYPPLQFAPEDFCDVDYIYISHVHPDHLDVASLRCLPHSIPILIHDYKEKFLLRILKELGFERVVEVSHRQVVPLGRGLTIEILASDNCDPRICGSFLGCVVPHPYARTIFIDSLAVFHGSGKTVVNTNDCPYTMARGVCDYVRDKYGTVDFALVGYSGAGPYPQCFENLDEDAKRLKAAMKQKQFLDYAGLYLQHLEPSHFLPFAGQYQLGGRAAHLNRFRGVTELEELPETFLRVMREHGVKGELVLLNAGETFDVDRQRPSAPFTPPDPVQRDRYIRDTLSKKRLVYEEAGAVRESDRVDLTPRLQEARDRMFRYQATHGNYRSEWTFYLDAGQEWLYRIPMAGRRVEVAQPGSEQSPFVRIRLDYTLLDMIINRRAHWNNAEVGSHLSFFREPDRFERALGFFLNFLHC